MDNPKIRAYIGIVRQRCRQSGLDYRVAFGKIKRLMQETTGREFVPSKASPNDLDMAYRLAAKL